MSQRPLYLMLVLLISCSASAYLDQNYVRYEGDLKQQLAPFIQKICDNTAGAILLSKIEEKYNNNKCGEIIFKSGKNQFLS